MADWCPIADVNEEFVAQWQQVDESGRRKRWNDYRSAIFRNKASRLYEFTRAHESLQNCRRAKRFLYVLRSKSISQYLDPSSKEIIWQRAINLKNDGHVDVKAVGMTVMEGTVLSRQKTTRYNVKAILETLSFRPSTFSCTCMYVKQQNSDSRYMCKHVAAGLIACLPIC